MSEHEDTSLDTGYSTPVPELDDHRHQSASVQKSRSRRGTADTTASAMAHNPFAPNMGLVNDGLLQSKVRHFEEDVIIDEESGGASLQPSRYPQDRSRRGTVTTLDPRSVSPPNSVKAFADARRRERDLSTTDPTFVKAFAEARRYEEGDLHRTISGASGRSRHTRRYTNDNDGQSFTGSTKSAEDDVCFPMHPPADKDELEIDFECLEDFIAEEESHGRTPPKNQPQPRIFHDLRSQKAVQSPTITAEGDVISTESLSLDEKYRKADAELPGCCEPTPQTDINRFEYFSSLGESTIHAAEFGDLILPGEDIRTLFTLPQDDDEDGVWWLNVNNPTDEEIRAICKAFRVHPLTIEDIGTQEAREKIELFPSYYFACFRSFQVLDVDDWQQYQPFNIYVVVFRQGTLSFSFSPNPHAAHVRKRITMLKDYVALSSDWICYALM
jgi:magnesium transporter